MTRPVSTGGRTRRVQLVRGGGRRVGRAGGGPRRLGDLDAVAHEEARDGAAGVRRRALDKLPARGRLPRAIKEEVVGVRVQPVALRPANMSDFTSH